MSEDNEKQWILNKKTGRMVKKGSITHRRLINEGVFQRTEVDDSILHVIQEGDNINEIKKQLTVGLPPNMSVRRGHGRNKGRLVKGFKVGRPKRQRELSISGIHSIDDLTPEDYRYNPTDSESEF